MEVYQQIFFTTLAIAFGLIHFILYLYNRNLRSNLYFAIFAFFYALNIFFDYQAMLSGGEAQMLYLRLHRAVMPYNPIFALLFVYSLFKSGIPRQFWIIALGLAVTGLLSIIEPIQNFGYVQIFVIAVFVEIVRIVFQAIRNQKDGAWIVAAGFTILAVFSSYDMLMDLGLIVPFHGITNGYPAGFLGLIVSMSIYLARDFALTNERILTKEREAKDLELKQILLEAEDARKSKELEEARKLQLSMLPICVNDIAGLDICFTMKTATEVGGDYYDYHVDDNGVLTIAIGDATGHGMKAGIMVSIIKSLFMTHAGNHDLLSFLEKSSQTIKQMHLGNLYMALMLVRIYRNTMTVASAGMPPVYIYRKETQSIEEVVLKGMPLGAFDAFPYQLQEMELISGDTALLLSDGLPELFNDRKEMFDYDRIKEIFTESAEKPASQIVGDLCAAADRWRNGRKQDDDITLIAIKSTDRDQKQ